MSDFKSFQLELPDFLVSLLIYGEDDTLTTEDLELAASAQESIDYMAVRVGGKGAVADCVGVDDDSFFATFDGMGCNLSTYTFLVRIA